MVAIAPDQWETEAGAFRVALRLGDRMDYDRWSKIKRPGDRDLPPAPSSYHVTYHGPVGDRSLRLESQFIRETLKYDKDMLGRGLHLTVSSEGDSLVIDEDIPNDCAPQVNYSYIRVDPQGDMQSFYFELPVRTKQVEGEYPHLTELRKGVIHYRYADGGRGSIPVAALKRVEYPSPPG